MGRQARGTTHHLVQGVAEEDRWETEADRGLIVISFTSR